jgi:hypothetical protein
MPSPDSEARARTELVNLHRRPWKTKLSAASQRQNSANTRTGTTALDVSSLNSLTEKLPRSLAPRCQEELKK